MTKTRLIEMAAAVLCDERCHKGILGHNPDDEGDDRPACKRCKSDVRATYDSIATVIWDQMGIDRLVNDITKVVHKWDRNAIPGNHGM